MKPVLLSIAICLSSVTFCQTIPLDSFFTPGTTWIQAEYDYSYVYDVQTQEGRGKQYKIEKDTIVSGKNCHLLSYTTIGGYYYNTFIPSYHKDFNYIKADSPIYYSGGWLRTDSNRVYFTPNSMMSNAYFSPGIEYLLYDFNVVAGSSIHTSGHENITVNTLDSPQLSDGRRITQFRQTPSIYWLYGIGSSRGLIENPISTSFLSQDQKLLCYDNPFFSYHVYYADSILPGNLQRNCFDLDNLNLDVKQSAHTGSSLSIFPNPLTDGILHIVADDERQVNSINISDLAGKILFTFTSFHKGDNILHVRLPQGTYLLHLEKNDHSVITKKINRL